MDDIKILERLNSEELTNQMKEIPMGNSEFQSAILTDNTHASARRVRHILLQLKQSRDALFSAGIKIRKYSIQIEQLKEKIEEELDPHKIDLMQLKIEEKIYHVKSSTILISDTISEVKNYLNELDTLPKFNREEFEKEELNYWHDRILKDAENQIDSMNTINEGTIQTLRKLGYSIKRSEKGIAVIPISETSIGLMEKLLIEKK
tara:strand:- start:2337 stop:2951 length:615 start_codon:yes stop_codon:yes gene_type:complete